MFNRFHRGGCFALLALAIAAPGFGAPAKPSGTGKPALTDPAVMATTLTQGGSPRIAAGPATASGPEGVELSPHRKPDPTRRMLGPPARTLFARSQDLDVTQPVSVSQILVLDQGIGPGTQLKIMAYNALGTWYQTSDPDGPNYVELSYPETGLWTAILPGPITAVQRSLEFELASGYFEAGQTLEVRYQRLQGPKTLERPLTLPIAIRLPNEPEWQLLPGERRQLVPGPAIALQIQVDPQIEVNQPFNLIVQPIDALGNPASTSIESFDLLLNNRLLQEINLKNNNYIATNLILKTPGRHQFSARSPAGGLQSRVETVWLLPNQPEHLIWTDFSERSLAHLITTLPIEVQTGADKINGTASSRRTLSADLHADLASNAQTMARLTGLEGQTTGEGVLDENAGFRNAPPATRSGQSRASSIEQSAASLPTTGQQDPTTQVAQAATLNPQDPGLFGLKVVADSGIEAAPTVGNRAFSGPAEDLPIDSALAENAARPSPQSRPGLYEAMAPTGPRQTSIPQPLTNGFYASLQTIEAGGQSASLVVGDTALYIAQPELTTDRRGRRFNLVEQLSGPSGHQWLSDYFADLGQSFGIMSRRVSFQTRTHRAGPQTAIVVRPGQTWLDALANGQTFVSSGTKARLSFSVNGALLGRTPHRAQRTLSVAVTSLERPLWVRLYRNGNLLKQLPFKGADASDEPSTSLARQQTGRLFLYLESDSKPFAMGVTPPRNAREWLGQIKLQDMTLIATAADHLAGLSGHRMSQSSDQKQFDFLTWTHGTGALIQLDFTYQTAKPGVLARSGDITAESAEQAGQDPRDARAPPGVILEIAEGYEDLTYFDPNRPPAATPSFTEQFDLDALQGQGIRRTLSIDGYLDQISLWYEDQETQAPNKAAPPTHQAAYLDRMGGRPGDYYTCQILLRDGTTLFSSPIFVGGFDPQ